MSNCILLVRVSAERQSFDEQERELYQMALSDGFQNNNIISIAMVESATILSEEERKGLNRMKEEIEKGNVSCVYAWEVSRISRRKDVLFSILRYLVDRKVNLKIKSPAITYLNSDGTINDAAELAFSLFATMAESEMRNKKARFKRAAKKNARDGKYSGGSVLFGYDVDENNNYIVNEEDAVLIKEIFRLYTETLMGAKLIRNELRERGIKITPEKIMEILKCEQYCGEYYITRKRNNGYGEVGGYERIYPKIISREIFELAKSKREKKNVIKTNAPLLAKGMITCPCCGWKYCGVRGKMARLYKCSQRNIRDQYGRNCENSVTVNIEVTDSILWYVASFQYSLYLMDLRNQDTTKLEEQIKVMELKVNSATEFINTTQSKLEKIYDAWIDGVYSNEKKEQKEKKIKEERDEKEKAIASLTDEIERVWKMIDKANNLDEYTLFANSDINVSSIEDRKRMVEITQMFVTSLDVSESEYNGRPCKGYTIHLKDGTRQRFITVGRTKHAKYFEWVNEKWEDITNKILRLQPI